MSQETDLIKDRVDIVSLVGEYVALKQAGQNMKGLCPFHQEKSPSFMVSPARNTWHCFGCSEGGDVFSFIQKVEGLDFPAALKMLAERAGVELKKGMAASTNMRQRLFDVLEESARFYHMLLVKHEAGKKALKYITEDRGLTSKTIEQFGIGYAPMKWDILQQWLKKKEFTLDEMIAAGVVGKGQSGKTYDRFRGRIMFPVRDTQGRVVAFGGRIVPWHETGNEGKYVNSPETMLYEKRRVVYNLNQAKQVLRGNHPCIVVEGYMDVVMLVQAGITNVVATSGTAFTAEHIEQLARFTKTLHFSFDADGAGWRATLSATNAALAAGMRVATVTLPEGKDPADIVKDEVDKVEEYMTKTNSLTTVLMKQFLQSEEADSKESQLQILLPFIRQVGNPIQQGEMIQEIANAIHVPEQTIHHALETHARSQQRSQRIAPAAPEEMPRVQAGLQLEHQLLGVLIHDPPTREAVFPYLEGEFFLDSASQTLYNSMHGLAERQEDFFTMSSEHLVAALPQNLISLAEAIHARGQELLSISSNTPIREGQNLLKGLQRRSLASRLQLLQKEVVNLGDGERVERLKQFQALAEELSAVTNQVET